ncbi:P-loop containing nucleoside triphosphate hydrolase protein [Naematelia encephala]|uniref:Obg-like ATPase 1 n=1 Tax=Naematelia encephala TaxID=71784 RepID=A0A1Y2B2B1_9TREE|nr:P-loop containing nucleoside triphosphate hydrolase protein [Naematelia encephala]
MPPRLPLVSLGRQSHSRISRASILFSPPFLIQAYQAFVPQHTAGFASTSRSLAKGRSKKMPPKKKNAEDTKIRLGRPGNNLKIGIVGLPNVGKSSFFNTLSQTDLGKAANFPYATIDPEEARIPVPDPRFDWLCELYKPVSKVPAFLTCIDIAGLTAGASTGAGLGNAFLSHVRAVDGIFQVVRAFDDAEVIHVEGDVDPLRDMQIISTELRLKDIEWVEKALEGLRKNSKNLGSVSLADKARKEEITTVEKILKCLTEDNKDVRKGTWTNKEVEVINGLTLLTAKPITYLVNLSERDFVRKKNKWLPKIKGWIDEHNPGDALIPFSVALEERLVSMTEEEKLEEAEKLGLPKGNPSALGKITTAGYTSLDLIRYFTSGPDEVRAWTIRKGTKAPAAAGVIHSDFENKFVCGEIMAYDDLKEFGTEAQVKAAGKLRQQGKPYEVQDGDICYWKSGA